jgi:DNA repair protein RadD
MNVSAQSLFAPPSIKDGVIVPRPYQEEALEALDNHVIQRDTNPCVVIPTAGGKSVLMAWIIQQWKEAYPPFRVCVLAHRKELIQQNSDELLQLWPTGDIGIFSAGLRRRDEDRSILFASIDTIYNKWGEFKPWDCVIVDEAHRIPASGEGKYRQFINGSKTINKNLRVIGFTATPFRMNCGPICHKDHILQEICYEANVADLIAQGYLCKLRSKVGDIQPELSEVKKNSGGDYVLKDLAKKVDDNKLIQDAVRSAMLHINREQRKSIMFFCVDIHHCHQVSMELRKYGIEAPMVTGNTPQKERDRICEFFKLGKYRAVCNVNVYTEGFNAKKVDCIVLFRPTLSKGLYVQMVGRGFRIHPDKDYCLVLDYAHCIDEHGPIDCIDAGEVKLATCGNCGDVFSWVVRKCPNCGWEIPKVEIERAEAEERERKMHEAEASNRNIIGSEPETLDVDDVVVHRHRKPGAPDSLRIQYRCGMSIFREWICLDHGGYAERKARRWWFRRFGKKEALDVTVDKALEDMLLGRRIADVTKTITVVHKNGYTNILGHRLKDDEVTENVE